LMTYRNTRTAQALDARLDRIYEAVTRHDRRSPALANHAEHSTHR